MAKRKKKNVIKANFKDVQVFKTPPEGTYLMRVEEVEMETSDADNEYIKVTAEIASGECEGSKVWHNIVFSEKSLWRAREALEAMGIEVPDGVLEIDPEELVGCEFGAELVHETYNGKKKAVISEWLLADEVDPDLDDEDEEDEDEETKPKGKSKKSKASGKKNKKEPEEEDEEEDDEVDVSSMDEDELEELVEDMGLDVDLDDYSSIKKKRKAVQEALDSEDDEDEDDDEDDETTYSEDDIKGMSTEELEDLNEDLELGIEDLDEMTKKTARRNVIKALKKKGLFEE